MPTRRRGRTASRSDCVSESLRGRGRSAPPSHLTCAAMNRALLLLFFFAAPLLAQTTPLAQLPYTPSLDVPSMDKKIDPCVDFYQYSCGGWMAHNPIPPDQASWSVYGKVADENARYLWGILEEDAKPAASRTAVQQKIGDYFHACIDTAAIEARGAAPLRPLLKEIDALKSKKELAAFLASEHPRTYGSGWLFGFGSSQDYGDATQVIAEAEAGGLGMPDRDYYINDSARSKELRAKYLAHVQTMLELAGEPKAKAKKDAATVMRIETALAKASLSRVERRNPYNLNHKMTVAALAKLTPSFNWQRYLDDSGAGNVKTLNVTQPKFFKAIEHAIANEPLPALRTYLRWHAVHARAPYLSNAFAVEDFNFYRKTLRGVKEMPPRWKQCVRYVDRDLGEALGQEFVSRTFTAETKAKTVDMTRRIETAMEQEIKALDWMTDATKQRALEKLHAVANKVGYPERWRDYAALKVTPEDFAGNATRATVFESERELAKIGKPVDRGEWGMTPPTGNAYYNPQMND